MQLTDYRDCGQGIEIVYLLLNDRDRGGMFICITIRARYVWWNHRNRSDVVTRLQRSSNYQDHHDIRDPSRHAMTFTRNWRCNAYVLLFIIHKENCTLHHTVYVACWVFEVRLIQHHFHSFITILGWILGKPLTLLLDPFQSIVLFLSGQTPHLRHAMT